MSTAENLPDESLAKQVAEGELTVVKDPRAIIRSFKLFDGTPQKTIEFAMQYMESCYYAQGAPIILQGERNDHVYFICSGSVEIVNYITEEKRVQRLAL